MVSICPHNRKNPVSIDGPCYRCGGKWKVYRLNGDERLALAEIGIIGIVAKCTRCGIASMATRVVGARSV